MSKIIIGIDPGLDGGACALYPDDTFVWEVMPTVKITVNKKAKRDIEIEPLRRWLVDGLEREQHVILEKVHAMPGQGVTSMFNFGKGYGILLGLITGLQIPFTEVPPQTWKKAMMPGMDKDGAIVRALQLCPTLFDDKKANKKHKIAIAEAYLMAVYGRRLGI